MSDATLIDQLAVSIVDRVRPLLVPVDYQIWDADEVAQYLRTSASNFRQYIAPHPRFPRPIRVPNTKGQKLQPRWMAREVIDYMDQCKER